MPTAIYGLKIPFVCWYNLRAMGGPLPIANDRHGRRREISAIDFHIGLLPEVDRQSRPIQNVWALARPEMTRSAPSLRIIPMSL